MKDYLQELENSCGFCHLPSYNPGDAAAAYKALLDAGMQRKSGVCTNDSRLLHVILPQGWSTVPDKEALAIIDDHDIRRAQIVPGLTDPNDCQLTLP